MKTIIKFGFLAFFCISLTAMQQPVPAHFEYEDFDEDCEDHIPHLIASGIDVNARVGTHQTPLMIAAKRCLPNIVKLLLEAGARANDENGSNETALFDAIRVCPPAAEVKNNLAVIETLVWSGIDVNKVNRSSESPLITAVEGATSRRDSIDVIRLLIDLKANLNQQDHKGNTPLIIAASHSYFERGNKKYPSRIRDIIKLLVGNGARIDIQNSKGQTAITLAHGNEEMEQYLNENLKLQLK